MNLTHLLTYHKCGCERCRSGLCVKSVVCPCRSELSRVLKVVARSDRELLRLQLSSGSARLGGVAVQRSGPMQVQEVWEEGRAHHQIAAKLQALAQQREEIEAARKVRGAVMQVGGCLKVSSSLPIPVDD